MTLCGEWLKRPIVQVSSLVTCKKCLQELKDQNPQEVKMNEGKTTEVRDHFLTHIAKLEAKVKEYAGECDRYIEELERLEKERDDLKRRVKELEKLGEIAFNNLKGIFKELEEAKDGNGVIQVENLDYSKAEKLIKEILNLIKPRPAEGGVPPSGQE